MSDRLVIAGAGHAAGQLVASLKQKKYAGDIVLVGEEPFLPYQRPPLSKKFLAGDLPAERLYVKPAAFYDTPGIRTVIGTHVDSIDRERRELCTDSGTQAYDTLVLATGSRVRRLTLPGSDLAGIHYLRNIDDVRAIRSDLANARSMVVVGAGYIGLEVAAVCRSLGVEVTVIEQEDRVMSRVVAPDVSRYFLDLHESHGVDVRLSTAVTGFRGDARVTGVETPSGIVDADFVVLGIGIVPNTGLADDAGLPVDNGIVVDSSCLTSDASIYAVGDCTSHPNSIYSRRVRLESVHNALEQARTAAANICGERTEYTDVPWFWSDQYDVKLQIAGLSQGFDETVLRGDPASGSFSCAYLREGRLIALDAINAPRDFVQAKPLIREATCVAADGLADAGTALSALA